MGTQPLRGRYIGTLNIALIGYGNVARSLIKILREKRAEHPFRVTGIRRRSGALYGETALHGEFDAAAPAFGEPPRDTDEFLDRCAADVLVELSPLNPYTGEPAIAHIKAAFAHGMHVVTANKGPVAHAYSELACEARRRGVRFLHESAVMDGAPVFNTVRHNLPGVEILGFTGVLNSTTKLILEAMERGESFADGVAHARRLGIAEENADYDTQGWDSAAKTAALANVWLDARTTPAQVEREGIHGVTQSRVEALSQEGRTIRLVSRAFRSETGELRLQVRPEVLARTDLLACVPGTSNLILIHTDRMGTIGTVSISPQVDQTAYGVYIDLLELIRYP